MMGRDIIRMAVLVATWTLVACGAASHPNEHEESPQEGSVQDTMYTLGVWRVKAGHEADFIAAWKSLGEIFSRLADPPGTGTLIQSVSDPELFYSFGPWSRLEDIQAMRRDPGAQAGIQRLMDLCTEATPGTFRLAAEVPAGSRARP